jgi:hypothetical protein
MRLREIPSNSRLVPALIGGALLSLAAPARAADPPKTDATAPLPPSSPAAQTEAAPEAEPAAPPNPADDAATDTTPPVAPNAQTAPVPPTPESIAPAVPVAPPAAPPLAPEARDELPSAGYVPGYRRLSTLSLSPYAPTVAALPGGFTPSYGAPARSSDWTFQWTGFFSGSLQFSANKRVVTSDGQSTTVFHAPPQTVDEYASFVGTSTMPGQWAQMAFVYGNSKVSANVSLTTWNIDDPSTYYQIGAQQFINNAYLDVKRFPVGPFNVHAAFGYFYDSYGNIGQYGPGMYTNTMVAGARGVGEKVAVDYDLSDSLSLAIEDGFLGTRNGTGVINVFQTGQNGSGSPVWPAAWVHHAHVGIEKKGNIDIRARLHYFKNWAQDDRTQRPLDNLTTPQLDESYIKDGSIDTYGFDASISSPIWGYLGVGTSYIRGQNAYPVKGMISFGGDGESLTNRWWGPPTQGTGKLWAAGLNYGASLARIVSYPTPFNNDGPDIVVNAGFVIAKSWSDFEPFNGRVRDKYGADVMYTFSPYMGVGMRADRVVPNSKDSEETFHVLAPRLVFRSDWQSRETITLLYAKWLYGPHTHAEASTITPGDRLDDQLFALNVQIWW